MRYDEDLNSYSSFNRQYKNKGTTFITQGKRLASTFLAVITAMLNTNLIQGVRECLLNIAATCLLKVQIPALWANKPTTL